MAEDRQALLEHYRLMRQQLLSAIEGLSDALMAEPTLDGWSIKDHLAHIAHWDDIRAGEVVRISTGHDSAWGMTGQDDVAYNEIAYRSRVSLKLGQVRWELETSRKKLLNAISSATPRGLDASLYGEAGLRTSHEAQHSEWILRWRSEKGV